MQAILFGYYGARNLGDDMMLFCIRRWLAGQGVRLTVASESPATVRSEYGSEAIENVPLLGQWAWRDAWLRGKAARLIGAIRKHDAVIMGGGDLIRQDRGWPPFLYALEKLIAGILLGKPVFLVNVGIGRPQSPSGERLLRWTLQRCRKIIVRDLRSVDLCGELGVGGTTCYVPDIVLSLPEFLDSSTGVQQAAEPYLLACLRATPNAAGLYDLTEARLRVLANALDWVSAQGIRVVFFPFHDGEREKDNDLHRRVAAAMRSASRAIIREWTDDLDVIPGVFSGARCVLAMRLHAAVVAATYQKPCVIMPYDHKVSEFGHQTALQPFLTPDVLDSPDAAIRILQRALSGNSMPVRGLTRWADIRLFDQPGTAG